ncbi:heparan-alpha-glucosaminide N-acetyltransferase isoform X2 [Tripterygium wilfordii]|uniref:heparan-alpha-glucosaminide N-acetyltransferase isoform X2 n=1 Tax=Tripterygium wilfordii TaxID=458696 RepID=UPI0018F7F5A4|nr:heparan-alpha-glucosaminide N-acetyltransferase isoform X2 [Tripterygium wilfordii]
MGMYEPIKGGDDDFDTRNSSSSMMIDNKDVESAIQISQSSSSSVSNTNAAAIIVNLNKQKQVQEKDPLVLSSSNSNNHHRHNQQQPPQRQPRLVSLDVFRGLTVALMILVDDLGGLVPAINHSPWNGLTLADFVMPFFLFIVGVALALAYKKLSCRISATKKATLQALKLLLVGLVLQGGFFHGINNLTYGVDIQQMRLMGVLQRIAIAYIVAALCEIWLKGEDDIGTKLFALTKYRFHWVVVLMLSVIYLSLLYGLYVPDWEYQISAETSSSAPEIFSVKCGTRGNTGPACNAVGMIDRKVLGIQHLYLKPVYARTKQCSINSPDNGPLPPDAPSWCQAPFDPEGLLSSVMAIITCFVGLHYGHIIVHLKDHWDRIVHWTIISSCLVVVGFGLSFFGMHINKALYTFSYMCVTGGAAGLLFTAIYVMVDVCGFRRVNMVFEWMGKHALMIYVLVACNVLPIMLHGFYWKQPQNNILSLIGIGK